MKYHPILFNTEMVRALLDGRKTQTRRVVTKPKDINWLPDSWKSAYQDGDSNWIFWSDDSLGHAEFTKKEYPKGLEEGIKCPFGQVGDRLWVKETWAEYYDPYGHPFTPLFAYKADNNASPARWKPSIHMPRSASRITLEITGVRVERLQDISEEDAIAEGIEPTFMWLGTQRYKNNLGGTSDLIAKESFKTLWDSINAKKHPWESNPWVWVIEFKRVEE